ncbi:MAG: phenylacetate-coenzyme A ligase [Paracoccaceae bacterium]|nr:MAG: phenylacetate-coenzyme A ligase [Paracoccaceae bacterium]
MTPPGYFQAMDLARLAREIPIGADFEATFRGMGREALRERQERLFARSLALAWKVPFYRRLWGAQGIEPGDIRGLEDLGRLPTYSKADLMASVEAHPPFGDFHGREAYPPGTAPQMILQTTSGTTGKPQPLIWGPRSREAQNRLLARIYLLQGMRREDVVHSVYGFGMVNGGHYVREAITHWVGATLLSAGTGAETRSAQQVRLMADFGASVIVGFGDYIRRLAEVARAEGLRPGEDIRVRLISGHMGADSLQAISALWGGAQVFDWYGVGDTGAIAAALPGSEGMHLMEDAQFVEILDVDSGAALPDGAPGDLVCTCLYKDDLFPIIRFNTHDVTRILPGDNPLGMPFRRMAGFLGRSDNMVKLRGINVFPQGIGAILQARFPGLTGEYVCLVDHRDGRDEMTVRVEVAGEARAAAMEAVLRERLGVQIAVEPVPPGATAALTQIETRQKPIRLIDRRQG